MYLKNFYLNSTPTLEKIIDKKFCSENIYGKFLVRSNILINKNMLFIDNGKSFFHVKQKTFENLLNFSGPDSLVGRSFRVKNNVYVNQQNKLVKFNYFSLYDVKKVSPIAKLRSLFYQLRNKKIIPLVFLKSIKGGFLCYFLGVVCFVRKDHVHKFLADEKRAGLKEMVESFNRKENFLYYPWYLSCLKLQLYYDKKFKLRNPKRKFYMLNFVLVSSKKQLIKKLKK